MPASELLRLVITADTQGAVRGMENLGRSVNKNLKDVDDRTAKIAHNLQRFGAAAVATGTLVAVGLYKAGGAAADLEQAVGGTEAVFKDASGVIDAYAENAAEKLGLSERAFREFTTRLGGSLKGAGFSIDEAASKSIDLTETAADLAATFGGTTAEAVDALAAALRGEADPAERFNLRLNQTVVNAKAVELGLAASTSEVDANAKAQATLALITEQSADAQGQFAREADSASGAMQIANARLEDAKASIGQVAAPIMANFANVVADTAGAVTDLDDRSDGLVSRLLTFGATGLIAGGGLAFTLGKVVEMRENLGPLLSRLRNTEGGLTKLGAAAGIAFGGVALAALVDYERSLGELEADVDGIAEATDNLNDKNEQQLNDLIRLASAAGQLDDVVGQVADSNVAAATRLVDFAEANGLAADEVAKLRDIIKEKQDEDVQAAKDQETNTAAIESATGPTGELAGATDDLAQSVEDAAEAYSEMLDAVLGFADADLAFRESMDSTRDALEELATAQAVAAYAGGKNQEANEELEQALFDAEQALYDQANAAVAAAEKQAELEGKTLSAADKQKILVNELTSLRDFLGPGHPLRANLQASIDKLNELARDREANITVKIREQRIALTAKKDAERAGGGPVTPSQAVLVGERGPEMFVPPGVGNIVPMGGGGGISLTINGNVDRDVLGEALHRLKVIQMQQEAA